MELAFFLDILVSLLVLSNALANMPWQNLVWKSTQYKHRYYQ